MSLPHRAEGWSANCVIVECPGHTESLLYVSKIGDLLFETHI